MAHFAIWLLPTIGVRPSQFEMSTRSYFDKGNNPARYLATVAVGLLMTAFMFSSFWWSDDKFFLLLSALVVPVVLLGLPRVVRGTYLACMGEPALRISEQGVWARDWSYLGMISWHDVASVGIETSNKTQQLVVHLRKDSFARLSGHDQVSIMLARLAGLLFLTDAGPNTRGRRRDVPRKHSCDCPEPAGYFVRSPECYR